MITMQLMSVVSPTITSSLNDEYKPLRTQQHSESSTLNVMSKEDRRTIKSVRFSTVTINEHPITVGCNPAVSSGVPMTIDWCSISQVTMPMNEYESIRQNERVPHRIMLKQHPSERFAILENLGYTRKELRDIERSMDVIRELREQSFLDIVDTRGGGGSNDKFQKRLTKLYHQQRKKRQQQQQQTFYHRQAAVVTKPIIGSIVRRISFGRATTRILKTH